VFADQFHGYGLLVIIDCGGGYHAVMSGMDQIGVSPGRPIRDGDPIGTMRGETKSSPTIASGVTPAATHESGTGPSGSSAFASPSGTSPSGAAPSGAAQSGSAAPSGTASGTTSTARESAEPPVLYFEFRKGGHPIDPAPWLRTSG
jgi:septal ring factor EnvC (AmiA/AmiB activator)